MSTVKETSKKFIQVLLQQAIANGDTSIFFNYPDMMKRLEVADENTLRFCMLYMVDAKFITFIRSDDNGDRLVTLTAKGIDFAEGN